MSPTISGERQLQSLTMAYSAGPRRHTSGWGSCSQQAVDCLKYYCQADTPKYTRHTRHPPPQRKFSSANEPVSWGTAQDRAANRIISSPNHVTLFLTTPQEPQRCVADAWIALVAMTRPSQGP